MTLVKLSRFKTTMFIFVSKNAYATLWYFKYSHTNLVSQFLIMFKKFVNQENIEEEFICQVMLNEKI